MLHCVTAELIIMELSVDETLSVNERKKKTIFCAEAVAVEMIERFPCQFSFMQIIRAEWTVTRLLRTSQMESSVSKQSFSWVVAA